jgi:YD repeat-containing protein
LYDYYLDAPGNDPGSHSLRRLTYPTGGSFSYKYGFEIFNSSLPKTTVVDSKTDSEGLSWQFTYTPAVRRCTFDAVTRSCAFPDGSFDVTNVIHPDGVVHQFAHIGANSVQPGMIYAIGLPLWSAVDVSGGTATEATSYRWGASQKLSNVLNVRPAGLPTELFDGGIYAPQLAQRVVNRNGQIYATSYGDYDAFGNAQTVAESGPDGSGGTQSRTTTTTYFVDPNRWIIHLPQDEATTGVGSITRSFDVNGNLRSESRYGVTTTFTYRADGEIATKTDARGAVSTITYQNYKRGIPQREEHPEGVIVTRVVSDAGNVVSETDGELAEVRYGYDGLNRITLIQHPLGAAVNVDWTPNQRVVTRDNYQQVTRFDGFARMASVEHRDLATSQAIVQTYRYDSHGRQTFASYPNDLKGTRTTYEPLGRAYLVEHASPVVGPSAASNRKFFTANRVRVTNERGFVTTLVHRAWGDPGKPELAEIQTPDPAATTRIARNGVGQPTSVTQDGKTRVFRYDTRFFLRESEEPETGLTLYGRDEIGNLRSRQVGTTPATTFGYDGRGRLKTIDYPVGTPGVTKTYYLDDKLKSVATTSAVREYFYDANKNLRREVLTIPDAGKSLTAEYRYDNKDAVAALVFGSGRQLLYAPDAFGRPTQIAPYVTRVEHYPSGTVARMVYGNGVETTTTLNDRLWPELVLATKGPLRISELRYGYDRIGNVSTVADAGDPGASRVLEYDPLDRLSSVGRPSLSGFVTYDGRGNIRSNLSSVRNGNAQSIDYIYDPVNDRLSRIDILNIGVGVGGGLPTQPIQVNFEYDSYGNVTRKGSSAFSYDDARQLKCSDCGTAQETVHAYDGLGMRVSSRTGGRTTYFMYGQSGQLLWEESATGEVKEYVYAGRRQIATRSARP